MRTVLVAARNVLSAAATASSGGLIVAILTTQTAPFASAAPPSAAAPVTTPAAVRTADGSSEVLAIRRAMVATLVQETNRERDLKRLAALTLSPELSAAAQAHAEDMLARGFFAHESPEGETSAERVARISPRAIVLSVRENILKSEGEQDDAPSVRAASIINGWMGSPGHRANLLADDVVEVGFGVASKTVKGRLIEVSVQVLGRIVGSWSSPPSGELYVPDRLRARLSTQVEFFLEDTARPDRRYKDPNDASMSWRGGFPLRLLPDRGETIVQLPRVDTGTYRLLGRISRDQGFQPIRAIRVVSYVIGG